ncbi:hypothetical protein BOX15_Mlig001542g5 [Macrostomum lignano]|uniref:TOG domain-containing protein n=1 Tax=Macrostomum lignano TaxID=282301 RepID=A0A267F9A3_9PLAT|nr:hypothetical protein BOX15_Mlig001542g5 [Macrostomum lignano]
MKPQLARSAGKKPKRATAGPSNPPSDSGVGAAAANYSTASSTAPSSTRGSQIDAAEEHPPPEEINGSLHYIRHSASRKKALKVFENAESNHGAAGGKSSGGSGTAPQAQDLPPEATGGGPQTRYNPHQGATFRPNPSYHSEVVGRAYGDDQASSSGFGDFGDGGGSGSGGTPPASVVRGRQQQRKHLRGTYSSSPIQAASVLDSDNADSGLQRGGREFNIVGRGVFEVQPAAVSPLPRAEVLTSSGGFGSGSGGNVSSAPSAVATDSSALSGGVQGTAYRPNLIGNGGPDDEEDSAPSDRGRQQQQQQLQRTLSNTLRESVALRQRQRAAAERSASKAETEDERLIRELREGSANADTAQLSHRQQQEQTVSDSDSNLAKELREEQLAISKRHTDSIGVDSDSESTRGSVRNYALASLNRKVSDQSFSAAPDAAAAAASPAASKPPAPRRNLSRPLRPSPSQTGPPSSSESLQSSAPAASGPLANPDRSLQEALTRVQASDWQAKCEGLQLVQRLAANHPEVAAREMHPLTLAVIGEVKNLRSQVSRLAMSTLGCLLQHLGKRMDAELEQCAKILLQKGSETNKFIQEDAESALMSMVEHCNQGRALGAIIQGGASHKSSQVRSLCAQILSELCDRMGPGRVLSGVKDVTDKLLATAANFCLDGSQETRYWGRTILYPLLGHQDFDALISKHVSPAVMRNLKDVLENLRLKGVGDQPPSTFSAGTKSRRGNSAGSADSASLAGSYASTSTTGQSAPLGRQRGAAGSNSRLSDAAADLVKTACQRLNAPDWKERLSGIDQLAELSQERTDLVGQCIVKFMDAFAPRLGDSNSKVQQHALETALQLVHPLRNYLPTVANTLVQHAAPVLSSKSAELASLAGQLLDIFILEVDSEKLAQPFVQAVATGNPRSKPELVDKLAALAERLAPRKPRLSQLHLEPELFRLLGGLASAPGAGSVALKSSAYRLAQTLASYSGPAELLDRARSNAQCTPQAVSMLEDALRQY